MIQDSVEDWRSQPSIMGDIYRNSFCNIAAYAGSNSHHGLLPARNPFTFYQRIARGSPKASKLLQGSFSVQRSSEWFSEIKDLNLCTRASVYQELLLAPRVLYFASGELLWKCSSLFAKESAPNEDLGENEFRSNSPTIKKQHLCLAWSIQERCDVHWSSSTEIVST